MFTANGRVSKATATQQTRASQIKNGKEFVCSACNERKRVEHVEFGEFVRCDQCGNPMLESYER